MGIYNICHSCYYQHTEREGEADRERHGVVGQRQLQELRENCWAMDATGDRD